MSISQGHQGLPESTGSEERDVEETPPQNLQREPGLLTSGLQAGERVKGSCFKPPSLWICGGSPRKLIDINESCLPKQDENVKSVILQPSLLRSGSLTCMSTKLPPQGVQGGR